MQRIEDFARSMLGVPWLHQGRSQQGVDCVGLCVLALQDAGVDVRDRKDYGRDPDGSLRQELDRALSGPHHDPCPGDIALVRFRAERHVGIIVHGAYGLAMIHACNSCKRVVEHRLDERWLARIVGVWRVLEATP